MSQSQLHFRSIEKFQNITDYSVIDIINYGCFGTCYKVKQKSLNKLYVWKAIDYEAMSNHDREKLLTDIQLMHNDSSIRSNIVCYYGTIIHGDSGTLYAIMEYCQYGDLQSLINVHKSDQQLIHEKFIWKVLYQTAKAIVVLHRTVIYLNMKPSSIFLDKYYNVKIIDVGLQKILQRNVTVGKTFVNVHYLSPEQICGVKNEKTDIWALGCLLHELCTFQSSFIAKNINELKIKVEKNRLTKLPTIFSEHLDKMIKLLTSFDHNLRPSVDTIVHHPTVICNYDRNAIPFYEVDSKSKCEKTYKESTSSGTRIQSHVMNDDFGPVKIVDIYARPQSTMSFDPKKITEEVYDEKFFNRLKLLRIKEAALKMKEDDLKSKEHYLNTIETNLAQKQKLIEKRERKMVVLRDATEVNQTVCGTTGLKTFNKYKKHDEKNVDLESTTCSADPGDTSIVPTAAKLDPSKIIKPPCFITNTEPASITNQCRNEQLRADKCSIGKLPDHHVKKEKSCSTLKKCKQLILKKK